MRLLVVEDEPAAAAVLAKGLREQAYAVDIAEDGATAVEQAGINDYDLILLDILMSGMGGLEVCRQLRAQGLTTPVLMLTARGEPDQQHQFMADASHELRTPVATTRTAANVALQQRHRYESEYRDTLAIIEQQATRLSRIVDDLFTLAREDAGTYPVRRTPMYLDEVVDDVVKAARVLASTQDVSIEAVTIRPVSITGDEDLLRRRSRAGGGRICLVDQRPWSWHSR
jgi:CheY-like chemotaxis protein